jgi:arylsulfatase A-like enzyme
VASFARAGTESPETQLTTAGVRRRWLRIRLLFVACGLGACGPGPPAHPPSIVLISIDTLRADHLSCYGYWRPTPHIDALCRAGIRFDEAHATAPWTLPSHMSLFTGRFPADHGVEQEDRTLAPGIGVLTEALSRAGYRTGGFVSNAYLGGNYGFARGFDEYALVPYRASPGSGKVVRGDAVVDRALAWLAQQQGDRPFFLFVHIMDPHYPYRAPPPYAGRYSAGYRGRVDGSTGSIVANLRTRMARVDLEHLIDLYDEEIAWVDALVGRLVDAVRQRPAGERTVVLLTSDHGEEFKEHGSLGHGLTLYREQSHVPLVLVDPASPFRGKNVPVPVRLVDVAPTLAEIARIDPADDFAAHLKGVSLLRHLDAEPPAEPLPVIVESSRWGPERAALSIGGRKAISPMIYRWWFRQPGRGGGWTEPWVKGLELYDVDSDPAETRRLPPDPEDPALRGLREWRERTWRGVRLSLHLDPAWEGELRLDPAVPWTDEPRLEDRDRSYPVAREAGRVTLAGLPGRPLSLLLPLDPGRAGTMELRSVSGSLSVFDGQRWNPVPEGGSEILDLAAIPLDAPPPRAIPEGSSAVLQVRGLEQGEPHVIDAETRDLLEDLGYGR